MSNPIIIEQLFSASPETVWNAITDIRHMRKWYFPELEDFKSEVGFETRFSVNANGTDYPHIWKVTVVESGKKIVYHWAYEGCAGDSFVSWELISEVSGTKLRLVHSGTNTFPKDNPDFSRESCTAGWSHIVKSLKEYLKKPE